MHKRVPLKIQPAELGFSFIGTYPAILKFEKQGNSYFDIRSDFEDIVLGTIALTIIGTWDLY